MSDRYGVCQVCGEAGEAYSTERTVEWNGKPVSLPPGPLRLEPCGHEQPRPVPHDGMSQTYPPA